MHFAISVTIRSQQDKFPIFYDMSLFVLIIVKYEMQKTHIIDLMELSA